MFGRLKAAPISVRCTVAFVLAYAISNPIFNGWQLYQAYRIQVEGLSYFWNFYGGLLHFIVWAFLIDRFLRKRWWSRLAMLVFGVVVMGYCIFQFLQMFQHVGQIDYLMRNVIHIFVMYLSLCAGLIALVMPSTGQWINTKDDVIEKETTL